MLGQSLFWLSAILIGVGIFNLGFRMITALIEDEEWGILAILLGIIVGLMAYGVHIYNLGR